MFGFEKIYSDNDPSKKLFEKLGAAQIGKEKGELAEALPQMRDVLCSIDIFRIDLVAEVV